MYAVYTQLFMCITVQMSMHAILDTVLNTRKISGLIKINESFIVMRNDW